MKLFIDIEANGLKPSQIWVVACKELLTGKTHVFREVTTNAEEATKLQRLVSRADTLIGHNLCGYDWPVLCRLLGYTLPDNLELLDTLIISRLVDYPREKHSIEDYGLEFGLEKLPWYDYSKYSVELEKYCIRDVDITEKVYLKYKKYLDNPLHKKSIVLEHKFQDIVNNLEDKGFTLDIKLCTKLLTKVTDILGILDKDILEAFPPRLKLIREVSPKATKHGTISLTSIPKALRDNIHELTVDAPFSYCSWETFNPASHKQVIEVLNEAGWRPEDKTKAHIEAEREKNKLSRLRKRTPEVDIALVSIYNDLERLGVTGWKINEANLSTLPPSAPAPARTLAQRILHEARRRTLTEWINLVQDDGRVHGKFQGIGAWTHRMSHQKPNLANVTNEFDLSGNVKLLGKELRQCWTVPKDKLLVGIDAEGIQLRIFAHLVNNKDLIDALVNGSKKLKTDPHSFNQRILGNVCKSRAAAKRFLYALFLGGAVPKLADILECSIPECEAALDRLLLQYPGFAELKATIIPSDAKRGWFTGIDGRKVRIPGEDVGTRRHKAMSGYLQNGEAIIIKTAAVIAELKIKKLDSFFVDIIHDEFQIETPNDSRIALEVADIVDKAIVEAGEIYHLNCPMAGSYRNDHGDYTIGRNWYSTH